MRKRRTALALAALCAVLLCAVSVLLFAGCQALSTNPRRSHRVVSRTVIGPLLGARLEPVTTTPLSQPALHLFYPASETCKQLLVLEAVVEYVTGGLMGSVRRDGETCTAVGIASLTDWRDRRPRQRTRMGGDTGQASYRILMDLDGYAILRGRFPTVGYLGWSGGEDTLAIVSNTSTQCRRMLARETATIVFKSSGAPALSLTSADGPCPIEGLSQRVPGMPDS